eukprot:3990369-Pleurochrysis_carterae.AAC.1
MRECACACAYVCVCTRAGGGAVRACQRSLVSACSSESLSPPLGPDARSCAQTASAPRGHTKSRARVVVCPAVACARAWLLEYVRACERACVRACVQGCRSSDSNKGALARGKPTKCSGGGQQLLVMNVKACTLKC